MIPLLWLGMLLGAQEGRSATLAELVPKLVENGTHYLDALPSLSCEESVRSQIMHNGKVDAEVLASATMTVKRTGDEDEPFLESHLWKTRNGVAVPEGKGAGLPLFVSGIFANALGFSSLNILKCNDFQLNDIAGVPQIWLSYRRKADADNISGCRTKTPGFRETVSVDRASGHVTRVLRTIPAGEATAARTVSYGLIEYGPVLLGADTFWLPTRGETRMGDDERRMLTEYSGCHRFASTVTITGGTQTVPDPQ